MEKAGFFDADGAFFRKHLSHECINLAVAEDVLPHIILTMIESHLEAHRNRSGKWEDFDAEFIRAYYDGERTRGVLVSDLRFVAQKLIRQKGMHVHLLTKFLLDAARECGYKLIMISGSPSIFVEEFAKFHGFDYWVGTELPEENGRLTGKVPVKGPTFDKGDEVRRFAEEHDIDLKESFAIGDSFGDAQMLHLVGYPLCINPSDDLWMRAKSQKWPIFVEERRIYLQGFDEQHLPYVPRLQEVLPQSLAEKLDSRLYDRFGIVGTMGTLWKER